MKLSTGFRLAVAAALVAGAGSSTSRAEDGLATECTFVVPGGMALVSVPFVKPDGSAFAFGETAFATNLPVGSTVLFWNAKNGCYSSGERDDEGWWPDVTDHVLGAGEAFWVKNPTDQDVAITVAGTPPFADTLSVPYLGNSQLNLMAFPYPVPIKFADTGLASQLPVGSTVRFYDAKNGLYSYGVRDESGWDPAVSNHVIAVGEGFWIQSSAANDGVWEVVRPRPPLSIVHRFYSKKYKGHFFTIDEAEKENLIQTNPNWKYEGVAYQAFTARVPGTEALYRFYSKNYRGHFFTIDEEEAETIRTTNPNWKYEGVAYYVYPREVEWSVPVFRFWSKGYRHHFYTIDEAEKDTLIATNPNWKYEGVAFYAIPNLASSVVLAGKAEDNAECRMQTAECEPQNAKCRMMNDGRAAQNAEITMQSDPCTVRNVAVVANAGNEGEEWTLRTADGTAVAARGVTDVGGTLVETREDVPDSDELESHADSAELVFHTDSPELESRAENAERAELGSPAGGDGKRSAPEGAVPHSAFGIRHFLLFLPSGRWNVSLWSARDGIVADESAEGSFSFAPPDSGVWHWLRVRDAADEDADDAFSLWIRTDWRQ